MNVKVEKSVYANSGSGPWHPPTRRIVGTSSGILENSRLPGISA